MTPGPHTSAQYQEQMLGLQPPGLAWPRDPASNMGLLALGLSDEFARLDGRCLDLIEEADPRTTSELLVAWETTAGLPDPAIPAPTTIPGRLAALAARLTAQGITRAADFIAVAETLGYTATISYNTPLCADTGHADDPVNDGPSVFWWIMTVHVPAGTVTPLVVLEYEVRRSAPDHTYPTFVYVTP